MHQSTVHATPAHVCNDEDCSTSTRACLWRHRCVCRSAQPQQGWASIQAEVRICGTRQVYSSQNSASEDGALSTLTVHVPAGTRSVRSARAPAEEHAASGEAVRLGGHAQQHERAVDVQQGQQLRDLVLGRHRVDDAVQRPYCRLTPRVARYLR